MQLESAGYEEKLWLKS